MATEHAELGPAPLLCVSVMLALSVLSRRVDHDESQYVAAVALIRSGLPYRDFAYLQTPLLPLLLSPLSLLPAGWTFIALRVANGLCGFATLLLLWKTVERRVSVLATRTAFGGLLCTNAFMLASSLARNDALPMVLLAGALLPLLRAIESNSRGYFALAGLLMGLAISAKISAALPTAGAALFILTRWHRGGLAGFVTFTIGLVAGLAPTLVAAAIAPSAFGFDVISYNLEAPVQWWSSIGQANGLKPVVRIEKLVGMAALGPVLVALVAAAVDRRADDKRRVLDFMVLGGVAAVYVPLPALTQYLVPLLAPLFARFAFALDDVGERWTRILVILTGLSCIAGLTSSLIASSVDVEVVRHVQLGADVKALARGGPIVTLSPEYVAGQGINLDPRFAAGPFLYRTRGKLALAAETYGRAVSIESVDQALAQHRPAVIIVGREREPFPPSYPNGLDQSLIDWSERNGYRAQCIAGGFTAFVARTGV